MPLAVSEALGHTLGTDLVLSDVNIVIDHNKLNELSLWLQSPAGVRIPLSIKNGGNGNNYGNPSNCPAEVTNFNMNAAAAITSGSASFIGSYTPEGNFNDYNDGSDPRGIWKLIVLDDNRGTNGTLNHVSLEFATCQPTNLILTNFRADSVQLAWNSGELSSSGYEVQCGEQGFNLGNGATKADIPDTSTTIHGLSDTKSYDFYVKSLCSTGDTSDWTGPFTLFTNPTACDVNVSIPDNGCNSGDTLFVPLQISNAPGDSLGYNAAVSHIKLAIEHNEVNDLGIYLQTPGGKRMTLSEYNGGNADNYGIPANCPEDAVIFSNASATNIDTADTPFTGSFKPEDGFDMLATGDNPNGIWQLIICDNEPGYAGLLKHASIQLYNPLDCTNGPVAVASNDTTVNYGDTLNLSVSGGSSYTWSTGSTSQSIQVVAEESKTYMVTVRDTNFCSDKDTVAVDVRQRPHLSFVPDSGYNDKAGVTPRVGTIGNFYEYRISYAHPDSIQPLEGYPRVGIDMNGDGDFEDRNDEIVMMTEMDTSDRNYADGKVYSYVRGIQRPAKDARYSFMAYDTLRSPASGEGTELKEGPVVAQDSLDLHIYANHIRFSERDPEAGDTVKISAWIQNDSEFDASNVQVHFYEEDSLISQRTIANLTGGTENSLSLMHAFPRDEFYPIKVVIDEANMIEEDNELNNFAIRPVVVGDFSVPGSITARGQVNPSSACLTGNLIYQGRADYVNAFDEATKVTGAEVKVTIEETGKVIKTYTNDNGDYRVAFNAPDNTGSYHISARVTDFTLVGKTKTDTFGVHECESVSREGDVLYVPPHWECDDCEATPGSGGTIEDPVYHPDLMTRSYHIAPTELNPDTNEYIQIYSSFENVGNVSADSFYVHILVDGQQLGAPLYVPVLGPDLDETVMATDSFASSAVGPHIIRVKVDSTNLVAESNETNNNASRAVIVGDAPDLTFYETNGLMMTNQSPVVDEKVRIKAQIRNIGGKAGDGKVTFHTINGADTTAFDTVSVSVNSVDSTSITIPWKATQTGGKIYAKIRDVTPDEFNLQNNDITLPLGTIPPQITAHPMDKKVCEFSRVRMRVRGSDVSTYQWQKDDSNIPGAIGDTLVIDTVRASDMGDYRAIAMNSKTGDTSNTAYLQVNIVPVVTEEMTVCDSATWHGKVFERSGTYTDTLQANTGCDSIVHLDLTVNYSRKTGDTVETCDMYTWNGQVYDSSGIYTDTLETAAGCDSVFTLKLTINRVDTAVLRDGPMLISSANEANYQWLDCEDDFAPITGNTAKRFTPGSNGNYAVEVTQNGCKDTSRCYRVTSIGIGGQDRGSPVTVYPNPAQESITLELTRPEETKYYSLRTQTGRTVAKANVENTRTHELDVSDLPPGVYLLELRTNDNVITKKVVVE